jgi:hypothetical protein
MPKPRLFSLWLRSNRLPLVSSTCRPVPVFRSAVFELTVCPLPWISSPDSPLLVAWLRSTIALAPWTSSPSPPLRVVLLSVSRLPAPLTNTPSPPLPSTESRAT